jgi:hypothetical protein
MSGPFVLFWHRQGNDLSRVDALHTARRAGPAVLAGRPLAHGVELDLKWTSDGLLYAHHGPTGRERLTAATARRRAAVKDDGVVLIDDLLSAPDAGELHYLIELKRGEGDPAAALGSLARVVEERGLGDRAWIAASSLLLLRVAAERAPALPRVLFADAPAADGSVAHRPTTYIRESLREYGLSPIPPAGLVTHVCTIGLVARPAAIHARRAEAARAHGLGYLPGRVTTPGLLDALAAQGAPGAFVYMDLPARTGS